MRLALAAAVLFSTAAALAQTRPAEGRGVQMRPVEETDEAGGQTQTDEERLYDSLVARFQTDALRFTTLVRVVPHVPLEDAEFNQAGFDVAAAWLGVGGRLGEGVGYFVRGAFEREPALLEAFVSYGSDDVRAIAGYQMVPFSYEFLVGLPNIDFVERSRAVRRLAPARSTGAALNAVAGPVRLRGGVFNPTYTANVTGELTTQDVRGGVLVVGRAQSTFGVSGGEVILGANAAYDTPDASDQIEVPGRLLAGADARLRIGRVLAAGEVLYQDLVLPERFRALDVTTFGGYATLGYDLTAADRVLARLDMFESSGQILLGYNRALTRAASVQVNAVVPLDDRADPAQALANLQLTF